MLVRLLALVHAARASFWLLPAVMTLVATGLALGAISLDRWLVQEGVTHPGEAWAYTGGPEGARLLLSTVAGSTITVLGVAFSITVVALQLAASQFGPRLLRQFMRDTGTQVALGSFAAIFTYCLLVLRVVRGGDQGNESFVPHVAVTGAMGLALFGVGVLIYFVHHIAVSIHADQVIAAVSEDVGDTIDALFPADDHAVSRPAPDLAAAIPSGLEGGPGGAPGGALEVAAETEGYIQVIDVGGLVRLAARRDLVIGLARGPGSFVVSGAVLARLWPPGGAGEAAGAVRRAIVIGQQRTPPGDVEFAFQQLVEVAVRALSPSINDPATAAAVVDRLGAALLRLDARAMPSRLRRDDRGRIRVVTQPLALARIVDGALDPVRRHAVREAGVVVRLFEVLAMVAERARSTELREAMVRHAERLERAVRESGMATDDRAAVAAHHEAARRAA
jgi:uncharacterized membrane protein